MMRYETFYVNCSSTIYIPIGWLVVQFIFALVLLVEGILEIRVILMFSVAASRLVLPYVYLMRSVCMCVGDERDGIR